jgi:hypothetical protein
MVRIAYNCNVLNDEALVSPRIVICRGGSEIFSGLFFDSITYSEKRLVFSDLLICSKKEVIKVL